MLFQWDYSWSLKETKNNTKRKKATSTPKSSRRKDRAWHLFCEDKVLTVTSRESLNKQCAFSVPNQKIQIVKCPPPGRPCRQCCWTDSQGRAILTFSLQVDVKLILFSCASTFLLGGREVREVFLEPAFPWCWQHSTETLAGSSQAHTGLSPEWVCLCLDKTYRYNSLNKDTNFNMRLRCESTDSKSVRGIPTSIR